MDTELLKLNGAADVQQDRQSGLIVLFIADKGYGFIQPDSCENDIFFHIADADADFFGTGDAVSFSIGIARNGKPKAVGVAAVE
jgi:cold shock CspA family protein